MKVIISRYNEDLSWIEDYNFDYIIYNKGDDNLPMVENRQELFQRQIKVQNIGNNQRDIFQYIFENYENLPETMMFIQGWPFDHCHKDKFRQIINNKEFTPVESFEHLSDGAWSRFRNGGYEEINNSWYIQSHNASHNQNCKWKSFDEFMHHHFEDYHTLNWIRFTPGSQYIITPKEVYNYPKYFWSYLMNLLCKNNMTEGHIIERALLFILEGRYKLRPLNEIITPENLQGFYKK